MPTKQNTIDLIVSLLARVGLSVSRNEYNYDILKITFDGHIAEGGILYQFYEDRYHFKLIGSLVVHDPATVRVRRFEANRFGQWMDIDMANPKFYNELLGCLGMGLISYNVDME